MREHLHGVMSINQNAIKKLLEDVTEAESLVRGRDELNHIRWLTGHITLGAAQILRGLGGAPEVPSEWEALFKRGAQFSEDSDQYPTMAELRPTLYRLHAQIHQRLDQLTEQDLDQVCELLPNWKIPLAQGILFLQTHEFYHAGQIAMLRRILGRARMFG